MNNTIEAVKQQQETNYNESVNQRLKQDAEVKQDMVYTQLNETQEGKLRSLIDQNFKIEAVKKSLNVEEFQRQQIERERDDNLVSYLEERERRLEAEAQNRMLRQQVRESDLSRIQQIEYQRRQRDTEFTQSQEDKKIMEASRANFNTMLENRRKFKLMRQ